MCGILGIIDFNKKCSWDLKTFNEALKLQEHRGPDDSGILPADHFILGHRRLSILDLDPRSKQPMLSENHNYSIVFNGEIYNYKDLKGSLEERGQIFTTTSDTEVLLKGLILEGLSFVDKCIGMFAFCFVNKRSKEVFIVRDRLGIKPLFYANQHGQIYFSSVVSSLTRLIPQTKQLSPEALSSYLSFRYPIGNRSFLKGIYSLEPGQFIHIRKQQVEVKSYWDPAKFLEEQENDQGETFYLERLKELVESSVSYRMIADVPFGAYLSGGVDSSGLVATMAKLSQETVKTFTIGFEQENFNEFNYAAEVAQQYQTQHREICESSSNYLGCMYDLVTLKGAPLSVPNEIPLWTLSKELKKYITVVLSGEGADELFMGYGRIFRSAYDYERLKSDYLWSSKQNKAVFFQSAEKKYGQSHFDNQAEHFFNIYSYTSEATKTELLSKDLDLSNYENTFKEHIAKQFSELENHSYENKISYVFIRTHLPGLLQRLDNATMAASVEGRVPFVDHRLVEFALTIPVKYKLKWNEDAKQSEYEALVSDQISEIYDTPKALLKTMFSDRLSDNILYRKKIGFPVPLHEWFKGDFRDNAKQLLLSKEAMERGLYNKKSLLSWLDHENIENDHSSAMKIWMLMNTEIFLQRYC